MDKINTLLEKYDNFKWAQMRSIQQLEDSSKILTLVVQDDDGEDIQTIKIEFKNITHSKILIDSVLPMLDMMGGITLIKENGLYGFALGKGTAMLHVRSAPLYIVAADINIQEQ